MTYNHLSDAMETLRSNACPDTDVAVLANRLNWSLRDIEREGLDISRLRECPTCGGIYVTAALVGHCSEDCKQKGLWMDRRRESRSSSTARVGAYVRSLRRVGF